MIAGMTYYQICWFFILYSILGWITEVIFYAVTEAEVVNRGFLNGPVCPVYGFGILGFFALAHFIDSSSTPDHIGANLSLPVIFFGGMIIATIVELIAGWLLDILFHARWWDYTDKPFNLKGYICLQFSIMWGFAITFVIRIFQPYIMSERMQVMPERYGWIFMSIFYVIFIVDIVVTVSIIHGFNEKLKQLNDIETSMRKVSDSLTNVIGGKTLSTAQSISSGKAHVAIATSDLKDAATAKIGAAQQIANSKLEALQNRFKIEEEKLIESITSHRHFGPTRMLRAFPKMVSEKYDSALSMIKAKIKVQNRKPKK